MLPLSSPPLQSRVLEEALQGKDLKYVVHNRKPFWCHEEIQDVAALLTLVSNPTAANPETLRALLSRHLSDLGAGEHQHVYTCGWARCNRRVQPLIAHTETGASLHSWSWYQLLS